MPWPVLLLAFAATPCQAATTTLAMREWQVEGGADPTRSWRVPWQQRKTGCAVSITKAVLASECSLRLTRERSRELWRSHLTFQNRTAPLRTEPGALDPGGPGLPLLPH